MFRTALLLLTTATVSFAEVDDILANAGTFKPKVTVSDSYSEKVFTETEDGSVYRSVVPTERIAASVVANLDGATPGTIDADTFVSITAGNFEHSATLGEAEDFKPTGKKVTYPYYKEVYDNNGDSKEVRVGSVTYAWDAKKLTVTVTCSDIEDAGVTDIAASAYVGVASPGTSESIDNEPIQVSVVFGDAVGSRRVFLKGINKTVTKKFGSIAADTYEELDLSDVSIQGTADVTAPKLKAVFSPKPNTLSQIDISGTADDLTVVTLDSVTVNGLPATTASITHADPNEDGIWNWNVTGLQLKKGANAVVVNFTDEDGNASKVTKTYTLR